MNEPRTDDPRPDAPRPDEFRTRPTPGEPSIGDQRIADVRTGDVRAGDLRIGDAERDEVMAALREHFAQGRLTSDELDERLESALRARTARDLQALTADLPGPHPADARPFLGTRADERPWHPWHHGSWPPAPWHHGPWHQHGPWGRPQWGWTSGPPAPWRHSHGFRPSRHGPWGPAFRHRHRHPPFPLFLLAALAIISVAAGTAWPLIIAVKVLLFGTIAFMVIRAIRHRGWSRRRG
ncbi:DUF1707 domain-containing protein [Thermopolyspora sp. NPDC052614]|uniref:DUF1707 SHOCT-like domain-containing protein n=1 Tax=Thermopolyspora sp. NPDC052614 TaxID=3155682 RepID=UPI0034135495